MSAQAVRVLLQQNEAAHYRRALYHELLLRPDCSVDILTGTKVATPFLRKSIGEPGGAALLERRVSSLRLPGLPPLTFQPGAVALMLGRRYDLVIAPGSPYSLTTWVLLALAPLMRVKVLLWTHGILAAERGPKWWVRWLLYRLSDGLLLYGERARALLEKQGLPPGRLHVIGNSLDLGAQLQAEAALSGELRQESKARLGLPPGEPALVFIGRLQRSKRIEYLVWAIRELLARGRPVQLVLIGEGEAEAHLRCLAADYGLAGRVHFLGPWHDERQIARAFCAAELCVVPSGAGLTVIHALGYGTPVLTHDSPAHQFPEVEAVVAGQTGLFYRHGEPLDLVAKIQAALYPQPVKDAWQAACRAEVLQRYHPRAQAAAVVDAVHRTLSGKQSRGAA